MSARVLVREDVGESGLALLREHFSGGQGGPPALIFMADEGGYLYDITQVSN